MGEAALKNDPQPESKCCGTCGCKSACAITPQIGKFAQDLLADSNLLSALTEQKGSPLNVVFPEVVLQNRSSFISELTKRGIPGDVLLTSKPNRANSILSAIAYQQGVVDVSSAGALKAALAAGIPGSSIQASGPKNKEYLFLALSHQSTVSVDSLDELLSLSSLLRSNRNLPAAKVLIRICGFRSERVNFTPSDAPFGINLDQIDRALDILESETERINFQGIHFHLLSGYKEERIVAFENALECTRNSFRRGLAPRVINVGGGFKIRYAKDKEEWHRFQSYLRESLLGRAKPITWEGSGLGLRVESGRIGGAPAFADHFPSEAGAEEFGMFLEQRSPAFENLSVAQLIRDMMLELHVEPGRALLDQAGLTVAEVNSVKESSAGQQLIMLDINHSNLLSREHKLLTQPVFIKRGERTACTKGFYLFGNLCIASDLIQYQKVYPGFQPQAGDLVAFINTAAYHMDFAQSEMLHQRIAKKVAVFTTPSGLRAIDDDVVSALHFAGKDNDDHR